MNTSISVILAVAIITAFMGASVPIEQAFASSAASTAAVAGQRQIQQRGEWMDTATSAAKIILSAAAASSRR